jgi:hypothetical protein
MTSDAEMHDGDFRNTRCQPPLQKRHRIDDNSVLLSEVRNLTSQGRETRVQMGRCNLRRSETPTQLSVSQTR